MAINLISKQLGNPGSLSPNRTLDSALTFRDFLGYILPDLISLDQTGSGDVTGPGSATADNIAVFNGTTGKIVKDGGSTIAQVIAAAQAGALLADGSVAGATGAAQDFGAFGILADVIKQSSADLTLGTLNATMVLQEGGGGNISITTTALNMNGSPTYTGTVAGAAALSVVNGLIMA